MAKEKKTENEQLIFRGKPFVRSGNVLYYGNPEDKYILKLEVDKSEKLQDIELSKHVKVILQTSASEGKEKVIRTAERDNLYAAMDLGEFWLRDALGQS